MGKHSVYGNKIEGREQDYIDHRTVYCPRELDINKYVIWSEDLQDMVVPLDRINEIMLENENLRETLYINQHAEYNRNVKHLYFLMGESTSGVQATVRNIEQLSRGSLKQRDIYKILYDFLSHEFSIAWTVRAHESKLQFLWRIGRLPLVSISARLLEYLFKYLKRVCYKSTMDKVFKDLKREADKNIPLPKIKYDKF